MGPVTCGSWRLWTASPSSTPHLRWSAADAPVDVPAAQAAELAAALGETGPTVICADTNTGPGSAARNVWRSAGFTEAQASGPTAAVNGDVAALDVVCVRGVDHAPLQHRADPATTLRPGGCASDRMLVTAVVRW